MSANRWSFSGLTPGDYVYGVSPLNSIPATFNEKPILFSQNNNDGAHFIDNESETGFTIVDKLLGSIPSVTVVVIKP